MTGRLPGMFRVGGRRSLELLLDPDVRRARRLRRILDSIQADLDGGGTASIRLILRGPRELYRIELERKDLAYQRITILDRDALTQLLEATTEASLRERVIFRSAS